MRCGQFTELVAIIHEFMFFSSVCPRNFFSNIFSFWARGRGGRGMDVRGEYTVNCQILPLPGVISVFRLSSYRLQMFSFTWRKRLHHMCFLESFLKFWGQLLLVFLIFCQPQVARYLWVNILSGIIIWIEIGSIGKILSIAPDCLPPPTAEACGTTMLNRNVQ